MVEGRQIQVLRLVAAISLLLALVNHVLPPKAYAATQLLFDYEFGLTRRGLAGEVLRLFTGPTVSIAEIYAVAAGLSLFAALVLFMFLRRFLAETVAGWLLLILALNSFAFASFIGNTGYLDAGLLGLTLLALLSDGGRLPGLLLRLVLVVAGMLLHENMLPYFCLLIGLDLWFWRKNHRFAVVYALSPVVVGGLVLGLLAAFGAMTADEMAGYAAHLQSRAAFSLDVNSTDVAGRSIAANFALMAELRGTTKYWAWVLFDGVPLLAMSLWLIWLAQRMLDVAVVPVARLMLVAAVLAPLSLNIIAFDVVRFGAASVLVGFIVVALLARHVPGAMDRLGQVLGWPHFLLVLVLNVNIFTLEVNIGAGHVSQFPWVLLSQLQWLVP